MRPVQRTEFGQRLYDARKKAKLTQKQLAEKVGVVQSTIAELEKIGLGSSYVPMLAAACGVSAEWLASGGELGSQWPFTGLIDPAEWAKLPAEVQQKIWNAAQLYITEHRLGGAGKSSHSHSGGARGATA